MVRGDEGREVKCKVKEAGCAHPRSGYSLNVCSFVQGRMGCRMLVEDDERPLSQCVSSAVCVRRWGRNGRNCRQGNRQDRQRPSTSRQWNVSEMDGGARHIGASC